MRKNLIWRNVFISALFAFGLTAVLGGLGIYWYVQQPKLNDLQQQINRLPDGKDRVVLVKDRIALENTINSTLVQAFGGFGLIVTAFVSIQNLRATQQNVMLTEEKQITERFTQAISQLGSNEITIRVGAIYALERIAKDSEKDHWAIMEILSSFVREPVQGNSEQVEKSSTRIRKDVQAAITVIGRRTVSFDPKDRYIDLSGANLSNANLSKAILNGANLFAATLNNADLVGVELNNADLTDARFVEANLRGAKMHEVELTDSTFEGADLTGAELIGATLGRPPLRMQNAILSRVNLTGAVLTGADMRCVVLDHAVLHNATLASVKFGKRNIKEYAREPNLEAADFSGANLAGAELYKANLHKAKFINVKNLTVDRVKEAYNWEEADYDPSLKQKLGLSSERES